MDMLDRSEHDTISILSKAQLKGQDDVQAVERQRRSSSAMEYKHAVAPKATAPVARPRGSAVATADRPQAESAQPIVREGRKVGRNEACPCGSGKKYKQCHGKLN